MKKIFLYCKILLLLVLATPNLSNAQENHAYWNDVQTIMKYDNIYTPPASPILFVGSSSIRKWTTLQKSFGSYVVMNRGVGGFVTNDLIFYANELIFKYRPRQLIIYVGENDLPQKTATADTIFKRFEDLYNLIRSKLPDILIDYIALKPSPSRSEFYQKAKTANKMISDFLKEQHNAKFIDVFTPMYNNGKGRPELFVGDMLHMNEKGYGIWEELVRPYLLKP